jgi:hypothetical protein
MWSSSSVIAHAPQIREHREEAAVVLSCCRDPQLREHVPNVRVAVTPRVVAASPESRVASSTEPAIAVTTEPEMTAIRNTRCLESRVAVKTLLSS